MLSGAGVIISDGSQGVVTKKLSSFVNFQCHKFLFGDPAAFFTSVFTLVCAWAKEVHKDESDGTRLYSKLQNK